MAKGVEDTTKCYLCCLTFIRLIIIMLTIFLVFFIKFNNDILFKTTKLVYEQSPIFDITIKSLSEGCPEGTELIELSKYHGTKEGCKCQNENKDYVTTKCDSSCTKIEKTEAQVLYKWRNNIFCKKTNPDYTYEHLLTQYQRYDTCGDDLKQCGVLDRNGSLLCLPKDAECPLNYMEINTLPSKHSHLTNINENVYEYGDGYYLHYSNEAVYNYVIMDIKVGHELLCFYNEQMYLRENAYMLDKVEECGYSHESPIYNETYTVIDSYREYTYYTENELDTTISKLYGYPGLDRGNRVYLYQGTFPGLKPAKCFSSELINDSQKMIDKIVILGMTIFVLSILYFCYSILSCIDKVTTITFFTRFYMLILFILDLVLLIITIITIYFNIKISIDIDCAGAMYKTLLVFYNLQNRKRIVCLGLIAIFTIMPFVTFWCGAKNQKLTYTYKLKHNITLLERKFSVKNIHPKNIYVLIILSDGRIVTGSEDGSICISTIHYKNKTSKSEITHNNAHSAKITSIQEITAMTLLSCGGDAAIKYWSINYGQLDLVKEISNLNYIPRYVIPFTNDKFAVVNLSTHVPIYQVDTYEEIGSFDENVNVVSLVSNEKHLQLIAGCGYPGQSAFIVFKDMQTFEGNKKIELVDVPETGGLELLSEGMIGVAMKTVAVVIINVDTYEIVKEIRGEDANFEMNFKMCALNANSFIIGGMERINQISLNDFSVLYRGKRYNSFKGKGIAVVQKGKFIICDNYYNGFCVFQTWADKVEKKENEEKQVLII